MLSPPARRHAEGPAGQEDPDGSYLTDGRRLFRLVPQLPASSQRRFASLEDCLTLEVSAYSPRELERMRLRRVRAHL